MITALFPPPPPQNLTSAGMAGSQRICNSTAPFSGSSLADLKASYPKCTAGEKGTQQQQGAEEEEDEEQWKSSKVDYIVRLSPLLSKVLTQGSAEQVGETSLKSSPFIAQAECNYDDSIISKQSKLSSSNMPPSSR